MAYVIALDAGATQVKAALFNVDYITFEPQHDMENDYAKWRDAVKRASSWLN